MQLHLQHINWIDIAILTLLSISVIMGIIRGFVREAFSLVTWLMAVFLGIRYTIPFSNYLASIDMLGLRYLVSFVILVLTTLIIGGLLSHLIGRLIKFTGFGVTDRIIGTFFGLARGVIVISLVILVAAFTPFSKDPLWTTSQLIPRFQPLGLWMRDSFPVNFADWLKEGIPEELLKKLHL